MGFEAERGGRGPVQIRVLPGLWFSFAVSGLPRDQLHHGKDLDWYVTLVGLAFAGLTITDISRRFDDPTGKVERQMHLLRNDLSSSTAKKLAYGRSQLNQGSPRRAA